MTAIEHHTRKPERSLMDKDALTRALRQRTSAGRVSQQRMAARYHVYGLAAVVYSLIAWVAFGQR